MIEQQGIEAWFAVDAEELLGEEAEQLHQSHGYFRCMV